MANLTSIPRNKSDISNVGNIPLTSSLVRQVTERRKWTILFVLCISSFMLLLDETIVNVAVPAIMKDFQIDMASVEWVLNGYLLTLAALLITLGRLADIYGRRLFFLGGMIAFTTGSVIGGLAPNFGILVAARMLQGIGSAAMLPSALSIITVVFEKERRGTALGLFSAVSGIAIALGPILGGLLTEGSSWRWVFLINVPPGILAIVGTMLYIYESTDRGAKRSIDYLGVVTISLAMFALTFALVEGQAYGWTSTVIIGLLATFVISLIVFVFVEHRQDNALMDLKLFANRTFVAANGTALVMMFGMIGVLFLLTIFLQTVLGISAVKTGITMTPLALAMMFAAPFAGRFSDRIGSRWLIFSGLLIGSIGLYLLGHLTVTTDWADLLAPMALVGFGIGILMAPTTAVVMANAPIEKAGNASGTLNTTRQVGAVLGVSSLGAILQHQFATNLASALSQYPLPQEIKSRVIDGLNSGVQVQSALSAAGESSPFATQISQLFNEQFIFSLNQALLVGAIVVLAGAFMALLIENHSSNS